jgi:hypothetical protein
MRRDGSWRKGFSDESLLLSVVCRTPANDLSNRSLVFYAGEEAKVERKLEDHYESDSRQGPLHRV